MKHLLIIFVFVILIPVLASAIPVTVIRHDLGESVGELLKVTPESVVLSTGEVPRKDVRKLRFGIGEEKKAAAGKEPEITAAELRALADVAREQFPGAGYIGLIDHKVDESVDDKNSISIYHGAIYIARDEYKSLARIASWVDESRFRFIVEYGRILYPDGTEFRMNPADLVKSVPKDDGVAFFSNSGAVLYYNFPRPAAGCIVEYKYRYEKFLPIVDGMFSSRFMFNADQPAMSSELEVVLPVDAKLHFRARNMNPEEAAPVEETRADGKKVWRWKLGVQVPIVPEPMMPDLQQVAKTVTYSNQPDLSILFKWRQKVLAENMKVTPLVKETVDKILAGVADDPVSITRHLYHWMQREIRYVSIKSGSVSGQAGHPAEETLRNCFGDCVDKSVLFCTMLRSRGIEANPISIKTNSEAEMEVELPLIDANHSISRVFLPDGPRILDTTSTNHSFPFFRQDDHGIPAFDDLRGEVIRTPIPPPEENLSDYRRTMEVAANGRFTVEFKARYNGNRSSGLRGYYKTVPEQDLPKVFAGLAKQDAPDAELIDFAVLDVDDLFKDFGLEYSYRSREFLQPAGDLYILRNVSTLPYTFNELALDERRYPIEYTTSMRRENEDVYLLAPNWKVRYLPPVVEVDNEYVYYRHEYLQDGNRLVFRNRYDLKARIIPPENYAAFKRDVQTILESQKENVILERSEPKRYADLLILKDSAELEGEMIECTPQGVLFERRDGTRKLEPAASIVSLELADASGGADAELVDVLDADLKAALTVSSGEKEYPGDMKVILLDRHDYRINADGTQQHTHRQIVKILKEKGKAAGFDNWNYDPEMESLVIDHARSINGERVTPLSSRTVKTAIVHAPWPEYVRQKNLKFALPEVNAGTVLDYQLTRTTKTDAFLHPVGVALDRQSGGDATSVDAGHNESWNSPPAFFAAVEPIVNKIVTVTIPNSMMMDVAVINDPAGLIEHREIPRGDAVVHEFRNRQPMAARIKEYSQPPAGDFWPRLQVIPRKSWKDLYQAVGKQFIPTTEDLKAASQFRIEKLGKKQKDIQAIYRLVALEIAHLPVGLRDYSATPTPIREIITRRKAGVLDTAWLLTGLLNSAGYPAELAFLPDTWMSRRINRDNPDLAPLGIVAVHVKYMNQDLWLDPAEEYISFQGNGTWLEGRDALVVGKKEFQITSIPYTGREAGVTEISAELTGNGDLIDFRYSYHPGGTMERTWRRLREENRENWPILARNQAVSLHPNAILKDYNWSGVDGLDNPVEISMKLEIPRYAIPAGDLRLFHLPGVSRTMPRDTVPEKRIYAGVDLGGIWKGKRMIRIGIPAGWKVRYLPPAVQFEAEWGCLSATVKIEGQAIIYQEEENITDPLIPMEDYPRYREFRKLMADFARDFIILEKE